MTYDFDLISSAYEEKAVLHRRGEFDTPEKQIKLFSYRLQQYLANKLMFSGAWTNPEVVVKLARMLGLDQEETAQHWINRIRTLQAPKT